MTMPKFVVKLLQGTSLRMTSACRKPGVVASRLVLAFVLINGLQVSSTSPYVTFVLPAYSQTGAMTGFAVRDALEAAIKSLNSAIATAGSEVRATGNSLTANAQNLLVDIDSTLGKRLSNTLDQLSEMERRLMEDAILLTKQMQDSTEAVATKSGDEARRTLFEADITAYNASYSLPCRSWMPRVVYAREASLQVGSGPMEVTLRGNFLDVGLTPAVTVEGIAASVVGRTRNELVVRIPPNVTEPISSARSVSISVPLTQVQRTNWWLWCSEKETSAGVATQAMLVRPMLRYEVKISIEGTYDGKESWEKKFSHNRGSNDCDAHFDATEQFCAPEGYTLTPTNFAGLEKHGENCSSSISSPQIAGNRCIKVPATVAGCGYDNLVVAKNCKGRGWITYDVTVYAEKVAPVNIPTVEQSFKGAGNIRVFHLEHPHVKQNLPNPKWRYRVNADVYEGPEKVKALFGSSDYPNMDGLAVKMLNGAVTAEVKWPQR